MKASQFIDAIALLSFSRETLSGQGLKQRLSSLPPWSNWDEQRLLEDCYRSTRRLRELRLIEEVEQPGREKFFQITPLGQKDVEEVLGIFKGF